MFRGAHQRHTSSAANGKMTAAAATASRRPGRPRITPSGSKSPNKARAFKSTSALSVMIAPVISSLVNRFKSRLSRRVFPSGKSLDPLASRGRLMANDDDNFTVLLATLEISFTAACSYQFAENLYLQ
jgi:hypothetical protein